MAATGSDFVDAPESPTGYRLVAPGAPARIDLLVDELLWSAERLRAR